MNNVLLDLEMATSRQHEFEVAAVKERLANEALLARKDAGYETLLERLLKVLKSGPRPSSPSDHRLN
jgi:hypothetical protein